MCEFYMRIGGGVEMFGYVRVCGECMDEADYKTFSAYYCGLCAAMGKRCSQISRFALSYDMTFLAVVLSALDRSDLHITERRCAAHPAKRRQRVVRDRAVDYAADMGVILTYLKFADDWADEKSVKSIPAMCALHGGMSRSRERNPRQYEAIKSELKRLDECEKNNARIDEAADCFASILGTLFTPDFISGETERKILEWFGYNIGRWIYVIDAYNDFDRDRKKNCRNPLLSETADKSTISKRLETTLTLSLNAAASAYELLDVYKNDGVIRHIVYTSLLARQKKILGEEDGSLPRIGGQP